MRSSHGWPVQIAFVCLATMVAGCVAGDSDADTTTADADASIPDPLLDPGVPLADSHDAAAADPVPSQDAENPPTSDAPETLDTTLPDPGAPEDASAVDAGADIDAPPFCHASVTVQCGDRVQWDTAAIGILDESNGYNCSARLESGPEALLVLGTDRDCQVALRLADLGVDLDLFVLDDCDPFTCVANSSLPKDIQDIRGIEFAVFAQDAGRFRFVSVDEYADA